jgi:DNA-directed RNA polymerase specialized sigma24 family protein
MEHLELIRQAAEQRQARRDAFDTADAELRRLVVEGFEQGFPGEQLAEAAGLSLSRVYQIRDGRR